MRRLFMTLACAALLTPVIAQSETGTATERAKENPAESENVDKDTENHKDSEKKTTELQELVVKGENSWFENGKAIFIPSKSAKNLADDMVSLIERMNTGVLRVNHGDITTATGQEVNIFINGVPTDGLDKATFWPKNALRVEFMQSSDDPRFQGKPNILNFIMKEYVAGGLTRIIAIQDFPNNGEYSASSKLVWGKMTYQAIFRSNYARDHQSGSERDETYSDVWYDGTHHDKILRSEKSDQYSRSDNLYGGFTARYRTQKWLINHGVGLQWTRDPGSGSHGLTRYEPDIISGNDVLSRSTGRNLSPSVWGNYSIIGKWSGGLNWSVRHSHNNNSSSYNEGDLNPILNFITEDSYRYALELYGSVRVNQNIYTGVNFTNIFNTYNTNYSGSALSAQLQRNNSTTFAAFLWYRPMPKFTIYIVPQLYANYSNINHDIKKNENSFGVNARLNYTLNRRNNFMFYTEYGQHLPSASERNDLLLRQTELKWLEGNPAIGFSNSYYFSLSYHLSPTSWLKTNVNASFAIRDKQKSITYRSGGPNYDGVIGQYQNGKRYDEYFLNWTVGFNPFGGKVYLENNLHYTYYHLKDGRRACNLNVAPLIRWDFGNCSLSAHYWSPKKKVSNGGTEILKTGNSYDILFMYGNGNLHLFFQAKNIFSKRLYNDIWFANGPYQYVVRDWGRGRCISISISYTFDYGKKVDPNMDITARDLHSTSVLGSD